MNSAAKLLRQILLVLLLVLATVWVWQEGAQWLLRSRAQHLLADIDSLNVSKSSFTDAQRVMQQWKRWVRPDPNCTPDACKVDINLEEALPGIVVGNPDASAAANWIPSLIGRTGLRSAAAHGGFNVKNGVVSTKWFGIQVTVPKQQWGTQHGFVPYLTAFSIDDSNFRDLVKGRPIRHPNRVVFTSGLQTFIDFSPDEDPREQAVLMTFQFNCITRLVPCLTAGDILPEAGKMLAER